MIFGQIIIADGKITNDYWHGSANPLTIFTIPVVKNKSLQHS